MGRHNSFDHHSVRHRGVTVSLWDDVVALGETCAVIVLTSVLPLIAAAVLVWSN
jgi:hypothetical protein